MSDVRHSKDKIKKYKCIVVNILYEIVMEKLKMELLQKIHGLYLCMYHITQEGLGTERRIGNTVSIRAVSNELTRLSNNSLEKYKGGNTRYY